jgi:Flp pilus assembly protein TadG
MRHRSWRDERGFSMIFVAMGLVAFLAATTLAIDVGMFMNARSQAQTSADAGALAGATALAFDNYDNRSASGPAVQNGIQAAMANQVMAHQVSVTAADVTFPPDPSGGNSWVRVHVYRTAARGNPVATLMGSFLGIKTANVDAVATAQAAPANAETCVKPFTIPDRWTEKQTPPFDMDDTFTMYDSHGRPLSNPDVYIPAGAPGYTGYDAVRDKGMQLMIRAGTSNNIQPSFYFSWDMPGGSGGDWYRDNIAGCNPTVVHFGDPMIQEPGNMVGPTIQGVDDLIAQDPNAYWDTANNRVHSSMNPSPRTVAIPLYDPVVYETGKQEGRTADLKVANWLGFFVESKSGNNVYGRITPITGLIDGGAGPAPAGAFPRVIRLVQ